MRDPLVHSMFVTYQGSGSMTMGARQFFVRFAGCSIGECPIRRVCDEPTAIRVNGSVVPCEQIVNAARDANCDWLHITGGEPCDQPEALRSLTVAAVKAGLRVQIQTSGLRAVPDIPFGFSCVTVSPKAPA